MPELDNRLLVRRLRPICQTVAAGDTPTDEQWQAASEIFGAHAWQDDEIELALMDRDVPTLTLRVAEWDAGKQPYPAPDRAVLKRALKAFRKRLKLQQLDDESGLGGGPFSGGKKSRILAILPPSQYPMEVWEELDLQRRLRHTGGGFFELIED